ncbi:MAG: hypothetical protein U1E25_16515 [Methylocystis sp.]
MAQHLSRDQRQILRPPRELVGLKPNFTILDVDDQIRLLKQVLQAENIDDKRWPARALAMRIDGWKRSRPDAGSGACRRSGELRQWQGRGALRALSGAAQGSERRRLR